MMMEQDERDHWVHVGHGIFAEFMQRVQTIDRVGVKGMDASTEDKRVTLVDKRKIYATLDEIADLYVSEEKKMVLDFTESRVLAVLQPPTPQRPMEYSGFRWSYFKTPSRLVRSQDFFYLETMKPFVDVHGRRGWARCSHSIEHPMCPDNSTSRGINRGQFFYSGVVFIESREKGVLETTFYYSLDTTSIPAFLLPIVMKKRGKNNAALINHYVKVARMSAFAEKTNVKQLKQQLVEEKRCGACSKPMPKLTSKTKCVFCKSYVCKRCVEIVSKNYMFEGESDCNSCMLCAESHGSKIASLMDDGESSSATDGADSQCLSEANTPSSVGSAKFHHPKSYSSPQPRFDRCMSVPSKPYTSTSRLPSKLIDFGLDSINLRRRELPGANPKTSNWASPSEAAPLPSQTRSPATAWPPPLVHIAQHRNRDCTPPRHHHTVVESPQPRHSPRQRRDTAAAPKSSPTPQLEQLHEPAAPCKDPVAAHTLCDLSYLSAFKI